MSNAEPNARSIIYTLGHSSRSIEELAGLLRIHHVARVIDVRRHPSSRRFPQFNSGSLAESLRERGIAYEHREELGARRPPKPGSANSAWRDEGMRGFADYMESAAFQRALQDLLSTANFERCAIMCAEADPGHCHRQLIADALVTLGMRVLHILERGELREHQLAADAEVVTAGLVQYPAPQQELDLFG